MTIGINEGTQTNLKSTTDSSEQITHIRPDGGTIGVLGGGTVFTLGTVGSVAAIGQVHNAGTMLTLGTVGSVAAVGQLHNAGTVQTVNAGTVSTLGLTHEDAFATTVFQSGTTLGTVKAWIGGSAHYITDLAISVDGAMVTALYAGSTLQRAGTYYFSQNGGVVQNYRTPIVIPAGSEITFRTIGTGLATLELKGYVN